MGLVRFRRIIGAVRLWLVGLGTAIDSLGRGELSGVECNFLSAPSAAYDRGLAPRLLLQQPQVHLRSLECKLWNKRLYTTTMYWCNI